VIKPREQQDASEFLQMLLDQFPPQFHSAFNGRLKHTMKAVAGDFTSQMYEPFYTICLELKDCKSVHASFPSFMQAESLVGANQYSHEGWKDDAIKFCRIEGLWPSSYCS
jgi:ubiquitin C-terminal hydrolase